LVAQRQASILHLEPRVLVPSLSLPRT